MGANVEPIMNTVSEEKHVSVRDFVSKIEEISQSPMLEPVTDPAMSDLPESMKDERVSVRNLVRKIEEIR